MMDIHFLHLVAHSLRSDPLFWYLLVFPLSFLLGATAFLVIHERQNYRMLSKIVAYYMLCVSIAVLIFGLVSEAWFASGTGMNKPIIRRSSRPITPNVNIPPTTNNPVTSRSTRPIMPSVNLPSIANGS